MNKLFKDYKLFNDPKSCLIIGDNDYFAADVEIERIAHDKGEATLFINVTDFVDDIKKPFYYKYHNIIMEEAYLYLFDKVKFYLEDENLCFVIVLSSDFVIERDDLIIKILQANDYDSRIIEDSRQTLIILTR